jgi:hypothetical protein
MQTVLGNQCGYQGGISLMCSHGRFSFSTATGLNSPNTDAVYQQRFERRNSSDWVHAAGVFDGKEVRMFLNGQLDATRPITGIHRPAALPFLVGTGYYQSDSRQPPSPRYYFNGLIRGVRISNSARYVKDFTPPAELTADANTRVLLTFAEGKGTQTKDSSGNNFHGEIIGAEWVKLGADLQPAGN